jgi:hypothetical protein
MAASKIEKAGVGFAIAQQGGLVIEVRPHHDTISAFCGVQISFELLNGISLEQAKKILEVLNENVIGLSVISTLDETPAEAVDAKARVAAGWRNFNETVKP